MKHGYVGYTEVINKADCESIINTYKDQVDRGLTYGEGDAEQAGRVSNVAWVHDIELKRLMVDLALTTNRNAYGFDLDTFKFDLQFTQYKATDKGRYDWHIDTFYDADRSNLDLPVYDRKLSITLLLSDPETFDGGNLEIIAHDVDQNLLRTQGSAIIFPSVLGHRVTEVTRGTRYSLVAWIEGPQFK
jgi:PKHD-type hydroxylase